MVWLYVVTSESTTGIMFTDYVIKICLTKQQVLIEYDNCHEPSVASKPTAGDSWKEIVVNTV